MKIKSLEIYQARKLPEVRRAMVDASRAGELSERRYSIPVVESQKYNNGS